jgi:hypothetical protein
MTGDIIERAVGEMWKEGEDDCGIGHSLMAAGVWHLRDSLTARGIRPSDIEHQLTMARDFINKGLVEHKLKHCVPEGSASAFPTTEELKRQ